MPQTATSKRKEAMNSARRELILSAARTVFERDGLDGASLRRIAGEAGYTPAALYFHFDSKEALYTEMLRQSLEALVASVGAAIAPETDHEDRFRSAALGFFDFYLDNPRDLDLGFYLFRGGMSPDGVGPERDAVLNSLLLQALAPLAAAAEGLGTTGGAARQIAAAFFAHASGVLLLNHTGRLCMMEVDAREMIILYIEDQLTMLMPMP